MRQTLCCINATNTQQLLQDGGRKNRDHCLFKNVFILFIRDIERSEIDIESWSKHSRRDFRQISIFYRGPLTTWVIYNIV